MIRFKILVEVSKETSHSARLLTTNDATFLFTEKDLAEPTAEMKQQLSFIAGRAIAHALSAANNVNEQH